MLDATCLAFGLDASPTTDDPAGDVVEAGVVVFRRFTFSHPALFTIGVVQSGVPVHIARAFCSAQHNALARLHARMGRLKTAGQLGARSEP